MSVTREQLLSHIHQPLQSSPRPTSPPKSTYRVRWCELSEWSDFTSDAQTYWSNLSAAEKDAILVGLAPNYWDFIGRQLSSLMSKQNAPVSWEGRAEKHPAPLHLLNHARRLARSAHCQS